MTSIKKSIVLACAASILSFGFATAQTDPNAAAPAAGAGPMDQTAPMASDDQGAMPKKKMMKKKHMSKKMMKKKMM